MASSLSSFSILNHVFCRHNKLFHYPKIRFQNLRDNGKPANMVDANLSVLRERIEKMRKRERINMHTSGWNYKHNYEGKYKRDLMVSESIEIMGLACGAIGLVLLIGSLCLYLLSLLVYFCL